MTQGCDQMHASDTLIQGICSSLHHLGCKKSIAMLHYKVAVSEKYMSWVAAVPMDQSTLLPSLWDLYLATRGSHCFFCPMHVQQVQECMYNLDVDQVWMSDKLVQATKAREETSDKVWHKMQGELD